MQMSEKHEMDYLLFFALFVLVVLGLIALSSASFVLGYQNKDGDSFFYLKHQVIFGLIPGIMSFFVIHKIPYKFWKKIAFWFFLFSVGLLFMVFVPGIGRELGGARSWIFVNGISFQPSELVKFSFIVYLAFWLENRGQGVKNFKNGFIPFVILLGIVSLLIIKQPDIGTLSIIVVSAIAVYFVAGAPIRYLISLGVAGMSAFYALILLEPYRLRRITAFLNPEEDSLGIGYHARQAILAIGSGGVLGLGLGQSRQKFAYLPEVAADSIFAVMAEEMGFIVTSLFLALFFYIVYRILKNAYYAPDHFSRLVLVGIATWFGWQGFVNIGAMLGLLPLTGVPLPFVSYGGTALFVNLSAMGLVINITKYTQSTPLKGNLIKIKRTKIIKRKRK